ncbi:MAG: CPCC family cysteine-rich protein [Raoultibacter sp.]
MIKNTKKYPCPCCGNATLSEEPPGTFAICPVCYWEDDALQFDDPLLEGGANAVSLDRARENFKAFGACDRGCVEYVRPPLEGEKERH